MDIKENVKRPREGESMKCFFTDEECHVFPKLTDNKGAKFPKNLFPGQAMILCQACRTEALRKTIEEESNDWFKALYPGD